MKERRESIPEETQARFSAWAERTDEQSVEKLRHNVEKKILANVELNWSDLKGKKVLDVGSGPSVLSRVAAAEGIDSVISLDKREEALSKREDVKNKVNADAQSLPLKDSSIDLIISHGSGPSIRGGLDTPEKQKRGALNMLDEMERVLSENGEARIHPPHLYYYIENFDQDFEEDWALIWKKIQEKLPASSNPKNEKTAKEATRKAWIIQKSTEFLNDQGYNIELKNFPESLYTKNKKTYWVLKKRKIKES